MTGVLTVVWDISQLVKEYRDGIRCTYDGAGVSKLTNAPIPARSVPFLHQEEVSNIAVLNTVAAHIKLIQ